MSAKFKLERTESDRVRWAVTEVSTGQVKQNFRTREEARDYLREVNATPTEGVTQS